MDPLPDDDFQEPPGLRFLRRLVTVLTAVMIVGLLVIVGLFVIRYQRPAPLPLPESIALPDGATAQAVTYAADWILVLSDDKRLFLFDRATGRLHQTVPLD